MSVGSTAEAAASALPPRPVVRIERRPGWVALDLRSVWAYRELLYFLTWRDVKIRYKQTALGVAWAVLQPLLTMIVFTIFFGKLANIPSQGVPYPIFAYAGLLPWTFFQTAVTNSGNSLVGSANLVSKVYFPRIIIPTAAVGAALVDFAISFAVLVALMVYYQIPISWGIALLPPLVLVTTLLAVGVGMWVSALNVKFRDVRYALPFVIQIWMFLSPVIYPTTLVPEEWRPLLLLNPLTGLIHNYRAAILGTGFDWSALAVSTAITAVVVVYALYSFRRTEARVADII